MKHNHFAVKHSRLSPHIDFGKKWYGHNCSEDYWSVVKPIFSQLQSWKDNHVKWSSISNKKDSVYVPILSAFMDEIKRANLRHKDLPRKMTEYLLGEYDFYKIISIDKQKTTSIRAFNLYGTLNKPSNVKKTGIIPKTNLPTRIVHLDFKPKNKTTIELYMDNGWQFSFRIHSASTIVENSLKFDIQSIGMPTTIVTINCKWK